MPKTPPSESQILASLRSVFGFESFRPLQREIIDSSLRGNDLLALMPTGGGKSLCYQLPALLQPGVTVVVSPLIALMKDQVDKLLALGAPADFINSSLTPTEAMRRQAALAKGATKLLYVAPERLMMPAFLRLLTSVPLSGFAIDEAHCISEWGHDFRPEYRELARLRALFPDIPIAAFTATATRRVQDDIVQQLRLRTPALFRGSFDRANLFYDVRPKRDTYERVRSYLQSARRGSGIVYCQARRTTEAVAARLRTDGFKARAYHAGLEAEERRLIQEAFIQDRIDVIVATIAFGMGIDKPDVRFVIHYDLPKNLEGYYQESGRAGRDGKPSDCILFYSYADVAKYEHFISEYSSQQQQQVARAQLATMARWADGRECRRIRLLRYFDEELVSAHERCCDVCQSSSTSPALADVTELARPFLACVSELRSGFGAAYVIRVLRGSRDERILRGRHDRLTSYGAGRRHDRQAWHTIARALEDAGYILTAREDFSVVRLTERGRAALANEEPIMLALEADIPAPPATHTTYSHVILDAIKASAPIEEQPTKVSQLVRQRPVLSDSVHVTLALFRSGAGSEKIAAQRKLSINTISEQLARALEAGEDVDLDRLVAADRRHAIAKAIEKVGPELLRPIRDLLGESFSYDEIRYVRAVWLRDKQT